MSAYPDPSRPTPENPLSQTGEDAGVPSAKRKKAPPELGTDAIAVLEGRTFFYSDARGDVPPGSVGGLVHADTRFLNCWELTLNGEPLNVLRGSAVDYYSAGFFLANPDLPGIRANSIPVRRRRFVGNGLREEVGMFSFYHEPVHVELRLKVDTDFADLFEIKDEVRDRSAEIKIDRDEKMSTITFSYQNKGFSAQTRIRSDKPARLDGSDFVWEMEFAPHEIWLATLDVTLTLGGEELEIAHVGFGEETKTREDDLLARWLAEVPRFESDSELLRNVFDKSVADLTSLRITGEHDGMEFTLPAAGLPWFMTLFGRDTLVSAFQSMWVGPELARGALSTLAFLQGKEVNDFKDEEPGKIMHEVRQGELTQLGLKPHSPYYGSSDTTSLWLVLLSEYWRWTGEDDFVRSFKANIEAALKWIDEYGDRDGDGFIEYGTRSTQGLGNQCWRDSWEGVQFADARIPFLPIAISEVQGYTYDAKLRTAEIYERLFDDPDRAASLRAEAKMLRERFNEAFWIEERGGYYAIGLDADKNQIDSMNSNMGHLLWSGIVPDDRARAIADRLMDRDMFSGWGVRTMSNKDTGYNAIGYHLGTIWPHDNSIAAQGLARYGFRDEANRIIEAMLEASSFSNFRLPEAFAGFARDLGQFPVPYPTACSPQAWATGAPFLFVSVMLGLRARDGVLTADPHVPRDIGRVLVHGMHAFGTHWDVEGVGTNGDVRLTK